MATRQQLYLTLGLVLLVLVIWTVTVVRPSADANNLTILPIANKTFTPQTTATIPVYVYDRLESNPDKAQLWVNWGDGTAATNVVPANTAPLTAPTWNRFAYLARINHTYQNTGNYRLTLIPISSNGRRGQMVSVFVTVADPTNYDQSVAWPPSINKISDGFVVGINKAFNFQVSVLDIDGFKHDGTTIPDVTMNWGDGTTEKATDITQQGNGPYYTIRFTNKQYSESRYYQPILTLQESNAGRITTVSEQYLIAASNYQHAPYVNLSPGTDQGMKTTLNSGEEAKLVFSVNDWDGSDLKGSINWGDDSQPEAFPADGSWIKAGSVSNLFAQGGLYDPTRRIAYLRTNFIVPAHFGGAANMPKHRYNQVGTYNAVINVEDSDGRKNTKNVPITVKGTETTIFEDTFTDAPGMSYGQPPAGWETSADPSKNDLPYALPESINLADGLDKAFAFNGNATTFNLFRNPLLTTLKHTVDQAPAFFYINAERDAVKAEFDFTINAGISGGEVRFGFGQYLGNDGAGAAGLAVKISDTGQLNLFSFAQRDADLNSSRNLQGELKADAPENNEIGWRSYNIGEEMSLGNAVHTTLELKRINNVPTLKITLSNGGMIMEHNGITFDLVSPDQTTPDKRLLTAAGIDAFFIRNYPDGSNETSFISGTIDNVKVTAQRAVQ